MRNAHGQNAIEVVILLGTVTLVLLALTRYIQSAAGGRIKATGERLSQSLFDAQNTTTTFNSSQNSHDQSYANGFSHSEAADNGTSNRTQVF